MTLHPLLKRFDRTYLCQAIDLNYQDYFAYLATTGHLSIQRSPHFWATHSPLGEGTFNCVFSTYFPPNAQAIASAITEKIAHYQATHRPLIWLVNALSAPPHLAQILEANGLHCFEQMAGMALDLSQFKTNTTLPKDTVVRLVDNKKTLQDWTAVIAQAFGMGSANDVDYFRPLQQLAHTAMQSTASRKRNKKQPSPALNQQPALTPPPNLTHYVAYQANKPVATTTLFLDAHTASLYNSGTLEHARGQGLNTALNQMALQQAKQAGYQLAVLQATRYSESLFQKLGFARCMTFALYAERYAH